MASMFSLGVATAAAVYGWYQWRYSTPVEPKREKHYQELLHKHVGGQREVACRYGYVDVLTHDTIYEVKSWRTYKQVIGQLDAYARCFPKRKRVAVFFGKPYHDRVKKRDIVRLMTENRITAWMYDQNDVLFELN